MGESNFYSVLEVLLMIPSIAGIAITMQKQQAEAKSLLIKIFRMVRKDFANTE